MIQLRHSAGMWLLSQALAAALAVEAARGSRTRALLAELSGERGRRPTTLLASPDSRELEAALRARGFEASARGHLCHVPVQPNPAAVTTPPATTAAHPVQAGRPRYPR